MAANRTCSRCGTEVKGYALEGLCPDCLLTEGLTAEPAAPGEGVEHPKLPGAPAPLNARSSRLGDYELFEVIAHGGMGMVYKARQVSLDRLVALKVLLFGSHASAKAIQRFRAEAVATASLHHPNIVAIHEVGFCEGQHFLAMDYVEGQPLSALIAGKPLPPRRAAAYLRTIAEAVHHAHERGILHRDLKPSNVLIDQEDQPRITDFGLAKRLESDSDLTVSGQVLGSPNYMSPEQAGGKRGTLTRRSDIYSLGAMLYEMLTGRPPFIGEGLAEIVPQVLNTEPLAPRALNPSVPLDVQTVCLKCLEKEPEKRYPTALALAEELGRFLEGKPVLARPVGRLGKSWRWCRRQPVVAGLFAAVVLLFVLGFAAVAWQSRRTSQARDLAQGRLYAAQMKLAHAAIKDGKTGGALAMLRALSPKPGERDFRGFDWRYLYGLCLDSPSEILATNDAGFRAVDFSPDGKTVALGTKDGLVELYDTRTRRCLKTWRAHTAGIDCLAFYPKNNSWLATISGQGGGNLKFWHTSNQKLLCSLEVAQGLPADFTFSPGGKYLVTQSTNLGCIAVWEVLTTNLDSVPQLALRTNLDYCGPAAFSPDERTLAVCNRIKREPPWETMVLHNLIDGTEAYLPPVHSAMIYGVAFSPDGTRLATGGVDERVVLWNVQQRTNIWSVKIDCIFGTSLAFTPDGRILFAGDFDQYLHSWSVESPLTHQTWRGHSAGVNRLAMAPDGLSFASASDDGTARLWHPQTSTSGPAAQGPEPFMTLFSRTNIPDRRWPREMEAAVISGLAVSPTADRIALSDGWRVVLCDLRTGNLVANVVYEEFYPYGITGFYGLTFSPDGRTIAAGSLEGKVVFLDTDNLRGLRDPIQVHRGMITHLAYALNGSVLATGGASGTGVKLTETATGRVLAEFSGNEGLFPAQPLAVSRDGKRLATGSPEGKVLIRDIASRRLLASSPVKLGIIADLKFSPDGRQLAITQVQGPIFLWGFGRPGKWRRLVGHAGSGTVLAFSPDGRTLASGGMDHLIRLWHPEVDQEVAILSGHTGWIWSLAFTRDGDGLLSGSGDSTLRLWRALSFGEIQEQKPGGAK